MFSLDFNIPIRTRSDSESSDDSYYDASNVHIYEDDFNDFVVVYVADSRGRSPPLFVYD
jgi:hypothetical protein